MGNICSNLIVLAESICGSFMQNLQQDRNMSSDEELNLFSVVKEEDFLSSHDEDGNTSAETVCGSFKENLQQDRNTFTDEERIHCADVKEDDYLKCDEEVGNIFMDNKLNILVEKFFGTDSDIDEVGYLLISDEDNIGTLLLPEEVWCHIFTYLSTSDKASISLVSTDFDRALNRPSVWKDALVNKCKIRDEGLLPVLELYKFSLLKNLDLSGLTIEIRDWSLLLDHILNAKPMALQNLNLRFVKGLANLPGNLIGKAVARLRKVHLGNLNLSAQQLTEILHCSLESSTLDSINLIQNPNLSRVNAKLLGKALGRLLSVYVDSNITKTQVIELCEQSIQYKSLDYLSLSEADLSNLSVSEGILLSRAISGISEVDLWHTGTWRAFPTKLSFNILKLSSQMTCLDLGACDLSEVDSQALSLVVSKLVWANLDDCHLTREQTKALFSECQESKTLKHLSISINDLSKVRARVLAKVGSKLKMLNIDDTRLTLKQINYLFNHIRDSSLNEISIQDNNLSEVSINSLSFLAGLKLVNLQFTQLTLKQIRAILTFMVNTGSSTNLYLHGNSVPKARDSKLLALVKSLKNIYLHEVYVFCDISCFDSSKEPKSWHL